MSAQETEPAAPRLPTIGLAIIALDEEQTLPRLLASIEGAFDRVVLMDTGSKDKTIEVFQEWARRQPGVTFGVGKYKWCNDFSAARTASFQLLMYGTGDPEEAARLQETQAPLVDWTCWADCDDVIVGAGNLRQIAANVGPGIAMVMFGYDYAQHPATGQSICHLMRERLVRPHAAPWVGRVHEGQVPRDTHPIGITQVPDDVCHWRHAKQADGIESSQRSNGRNLKILRAWAKDEPENPRVLSYLGNEELVRGRPKQALAWFKRYWKTDDGWDDHRAQVCRKASIACLQQEDFEGARMWAKRGLDVHPGWTDNELTLGQLASIEGRADHAILHARRVLDGGVPQTLLIVAPLDYTYEPLKMIAGCYAEKGDLDEAVEVGTQALSLNPMDEQLQVAVHAWRLQLKVESTATTVAMLADTLIAHDEQAKALAFLEDCVPHFCVDHPRVVAARSRVRERLLWAYDEDLFNDHYMHGGSKPEDFHDDETSARIAATLPRAGFLLGGLVEQGARPKVTIEDEAEEPAHA